jgi:hypothetical protein
MKEVHRFAPAALRWEQSGGARVAVDRCNLAETGRSFGNLRLARASSKENGPRRLSRDWVASKSVKITSDGLRPRRPIAMFAARLPSCLIHPK